MSGEPPSWAPGGHNPRPRSSARGTPRRRAASEEGFGGQQQQDPQQQQQQQDPQQQQQQQRQRDFDDYLEETRFGATSMSSWESSSHSFDNEEVSRHRPSSSLRDRRKQFDPTTPTLIDEEDEEEMVLSLEQAAAAASQQQQQHRGQGGGRGGSTTPAGMAARRTPGATSAAGGAASSSYRPAAFGFDEAEIAALRRTPGATAMQRSASLGPDVAGLGYSLTLSGAVAAGEEQPPAAAAAAAATATAAGDDGSPDNQRRASQQQQQHHQQQSPIRPPLGSTWSKHADRGSAAQSPRPFSPGLQRLTEDIGNLLHEEDDDFALEIPTAFREGGSDLDGGWMGPFAVDSRNSTMARQTVPRTAATAATAVTAAAMPKEKGRRGSRPTATGSFLPNAQQPKPRRNANEFFEFGKAQDRSSPQMLNFGGAFSRPVQQHSGFTAPLAGQPPDAFSISLSGTGPQQPLFSTHSFDSYQSGNTAPSPIDPFFQPYRLSSPNPTVQGQGQGAGSYRATTPHQSDMHVSAPEFVPMVTRATPSPALMGSLTQQWVHHVPMHPTAPPQQPPRYDRQPHDQGGWHPPPSAYGPFGGPGSSYGYAMSGMQSPVVVGDTRSAMTPSPHLSQAAWQHQHQLPRADASVSPYGTGGVNPATAQASNRTAEGGSSSFVPPNVVGSGMVAGHFGGASSAGSALSSSAGTDASLRLRREARRGKRSTKKKTPQLKNEPNQDVAAQPDAAPPSVAPIGTSQVVDLRKSQQSPSVFSSLPAKMKKPEPRPSSALDGQAEDVILVSDDPIDPKRSELDESPATRLVFKEFYKSYRLQERLGLQHAEEFAKRSLQDGSLPESVHWRVYIELADIARRSNRFVEARHLYQKVCQLQPYASQGWIEYSKLEEECGYMNRVTNILHAGLEYCEYNENLLIRTVKHHERMGNLDQARAVLARLKHVGIDKVWRTMLEGASLEARAGNIGMARKVLQYIMHYVPWYGPLYVEFYRLQRDYGRPIDAMSIVELGLTQIPRYGPLWFAALRVCEELDFADKNFALPKTTAMLQRASANVSKEIAWKVHLEASFIFERAAQEQAQANDDELDMYLGPARRYFALTISTCRLNLRWKVWLAAARMELYAGNKDISRTLFLRAHEVAPEKVRSLTYLDFARLHEFVGEINLARALLCKGCYYYGHDWKVWLERVLLETRGYNHKKAFEVAKRALDIHPGTGRLWSALVQLSYFVGGDDAQYSALRDALNAVPKSGEVWCEGARIHLNPFSDLFDIDRARRHLHFAEKFTPQYGDTFLEAVRLELLDQWMEPIADMIWTKTKNSFISTSKSSKNQDWLTKFITDVTLAVSCARQSSEEAKNFPGLAHETIIPKVRGKLFAEGTLSKVDFSTIVMACSNADPNYGPLWFNCRRVQTDPPRCVVEQAARVMLEELRSQAHVYLAAMVRRRAVLSTIAGEKPKGVDRRKGAAGNWSSQAVEVFDLELMEWEDRADSLLRASPSLRDIFNPVDPTTGLVLLQSTINGSDFVTGLMDFNRRRPIEAMSFSDRRRAIFATDALFP